MVGLEWCSIEYLKIARCHKIGLELGLRQSLSFKANCRPWGQRMAVVSCQRGGAEGDTWRARITFVVSKSWASQKIYQKILGAWTGARQTVWKEGEAGATGRNLKFREISQVRKGFRFTQLGSVKDKLESNKILLDLWNYFRIQTT